MSVCVCVTVCWTFLELNPFTNFHEHFFNWNQFTNSYLARQSIQLFSTNCWHVNKCFDIQIGPLSLRCVTACVRVCVFFTLKFCRSEYQLSVSFYTGVIQKKFPYSVYSFCINPYPSEQTTNKTWQAWVFPMKTMDNFTTVTWNFLSQLCMQMGWSPNIISC